MPAKKAPASPEIQALLELERREMQQPGAMPPELKAKLQGYRQQGVVPQFGGQLTEAQSKAAAFLGRTIGADRDYLASGASSTEPRSYSGYIVHGAAPIATNRYDADGRQASEQAKKDFISASLRLESGAAINPDEFARQDQIFYPQPGDGPSVVAQKARARQRVIEGFRVGAGPGAQQIEDRINKLYENQPAGAADKAPVTLAPGASIPPPGSTTPPGTTPTAPTGGAPMSIATPRAQGDHLDASRNPLDFTGDIAPGSAGKGRGTTEVMDHAEQTLYTTDHDRAYAAALQGAFNQGADRSHLDAIAKLYGYPALSADLDAAIAYRDDPKKPGKGGKGIAILTPASGVDNPDAMHRLMAPVSASAPGAAVTGALNGVTLGGADELAGAGDALFRGKPLGESIRHANEQKQAIATLHPGPYRGGEMLGALGSAYGISRAAGVKAAETLAPKALALDAAIGGAYGGLENNDDRLGGAAVGAGTSLAGGVVGRGAINALAAPIAARAGGDAAFLSANGVRVMPGQAAGGLANRLEQGLTSVPGPGDLIIAGRKQALGDFNNGFLNDGLQHIGEKLPEGAKGMKAMAYAQNAFNRAYDSARSGMSLAFDGQLGQDLSAIDQHVANGGVSGDVADRVSKIYASQIEQRMKLGRPLNGSEYKRMMNFIEGVRSTAMKEGNIELADTLGSMTDALDAAARRSSAPEAVVAMDKADKGYALFVRAERAAAMRGGETGTFTPSQLDRSVQRSDSTVRSKAYQRGDALGQRWSEAGKSVLGDTVPDSGTAFRGMTGVGALGALYTHPGTAIPAAGLAALYAPGVRSLAGKAVIGRVNAGPIAQSIADGLRSRVAPLGTTVAAPLSLLYQQEQP